jgi:hypothetical protein
VAPKHSSILSVSAGEAHVSPPAPSTTLHQTEEIPLLKPYGVAYYPPGRTAVCLGCHVCIWKGHLHGHITLKNHWDPLNISKKPSKTVIAKAVKNYDFLDDNKHVPLPPGPFAPFPFLELLPRDAPPHLRDVIGWHCKGCDKNGRPYQYCCATANSMDKHISSKHRLKRDQKGYSLKQMDCRGHIQHFFLYGEGSHYFRVDPTLLGVQPGSDFDIWYQSLTNAERHPELSTVALTGDGDEGIEMDLPPFLTKAGWINQLHGFSWQHLRKQVLCTRPTVDKSQYLRLPKIARLYFQSTSQSEVTQRLHPANVNILNHWKKWALYAFFSVPCLIDVFLRLPFKLLTNDTTVGGYANAAS